MEKTKQEIITAFPCIFCRERTRALFHTFIVCERCKYAFLKIYKTIKLGGF